MLDFDWTDSLLCFIIGHMKAMVIYNPVSGPRDVRRRLNEVIAFLRGQGWEVTVRETHGHGDATTYAREAVAARCDRVLVAAGDGTLQQAVDGLVGTDVALGALPVGHSNVWARQIGLPVWSPVRHRALIAAAEAALVSEVRRIDVGRAGRRHFLQWSGIGFDARVAERVEPHLPIKRSLGGLAYIIAGVVEVLSLGGTRMVLTVDGEVHCSRILMIVVSNAQLYGRVVRVASRAQLDDGWLDVCVFKGHNTIGMISHVGRVFMQKHLGNPQLEYYRARRIRIETADPLPVHLDGDPLDHTPLDIAVVPRALNVLVPPSAPPDLFCDSSSEQ